MHEIDILRVLHQLREHTRSSFLKLGKRHMSIMRSADVFQQLSHVTLVSAKSESDSGTDSLIS